MRIRNQLICLYRKFLGRLLTASAAISKSFDADAKVAFLGRGTAGDAWDAMNLLATIGIHGSARAPPTRRGFHRSTLERRSNASFPCCLPARIISGREEAHALTTQANTTTEPEKEYSHATDNFFPNEYE